MKNDSSNRCLPRDRLLHKLRDKRLLSLRNKDTHPFKSARRAVHVPSAAQVRRTLGALIHRSLCQGSIFSPWGMLGNFVDQNVALSTEPFVIYCTLSSLPHPDTHTIYEDNCKARRAPTEPSLMNRKTEMGERGKM